ncbi:Uncharacterized ABC transporter ATP-binding protein MJ0796 [Geodia barretti]|uniref:Uncharacterized ABC transporter ATP-binding protein MJ0796 n=1 Tax=Geodia barretti TaxID=519541 RepID=A0AA35WI31_GEOBA|nr:Uncharacterized ABC transporter ATP-binding protein MJ0796 [Geodia barretti]
MRDVTKVYQMGEVQVHALRGVSVDLKVGGFTVLLGPSGSGKSTLLNILGGLDVPTSGQVLYRGQDLTRADEGELTQYRRRRVGFVFQFYNLIPSLTARENVELVTEISEDPLPAQEALDIQRVAIARAIAKRPDILLCDEPTGALDITTGIQVLEALERVNREYGATTAIITHNAAIATIADRVISLADGRISQQRVNGTRAAASTIEW